jgi:hypothetical protein
MMHRPDSTSFRWRLAGALSPELVAAGLSLIVLVIIGFLVSQGLFPG